MAVASYVNQTVYYYPKSLGGTRGVEVFANMSAGEVITRTAINMRVPGFGAGDFICGSVGPLSVGGQGGGQDREWVRKYHLTLKRVSLHSSTIFTGVVLALRSLSRKISRRFASLLVELVCVDIFVYMTSRISR